MQNVCKVDLHVHSKYSDKPTNWLLKKFGGAECFSEPKQIYQESKNLGMKFITITDHNDIRGCLEIRHLPNTFISCEVTTTFPEDGCKIHILVYDISETQYYEMMKIRHNIYELRNYIVDNNIYYSVAHPLYSINNKLDIEHYEKLIILFNTFEINGCRSVYSNKILKNLLNNITPELIKNLSQKYNLEPYGNSWQKKLTGGSDDHTGIKIASKYTEVTNCDDLQDFLKKACFEGKAAIKGSHCEPKDLAHNLYSVAYQFYFKKTNLKKFVSKDSSLKIIDQLLTNKKREEDIFSKLIRNIRSSKYHSGKAEQPEIITNSIKHIISKTMITNHSDIIKDANSGNIAEKWYTVASDNINQGLSHLISYMLSTAKKGNVFDIFHTLGSVGSLYFLIAPYFIAYSIFEKDKKYANKLKNTYLKEDLSIKLAHFSDTFYDINGVANTLQQTLKTAKKFGRDYHILTCADTQKQDFKKIMDEHVFQPVGQFEMPEYSELKFNYPPFLDMLDFCYQNSFTHIHCATPGIVGLAGLAISKILKKPIYGTYHTAFPQYVAYLLDDHTIEKAAWHYMIWFYNQMNIVFVPSNAMKKELIEKGINENKIKLYPRGIDTDRFKPVGGKSETDIKLLYVGRISKEKNLHLLTKVFKRISEENSSISLEVVGDGPYREEMFKYLKGTNVSFTGYKKGEELVQIYSAADLFIFPSTTDTFGNVVLESQACATPVVVTDSGGPMENIIPGETGIIVKGNDENALYKGIKSILDKRTLSLMSEKAANYMKNRSFDSAFLASWDFYTHQKEDSEEADIEINMPVSL